MAGTIVDAQGRALPLFGLLDAHGHPAPMTEAHAVETFHLFGTAVYFLPLLGALISDLFLGKYRTIFYLSIVYCCGHLALAMNSTRLGLAIGLSLIAFGAGGIKPCVSANVGDQFGAANQHLLERVYGWFYFSINIGAGISQLSIPWLLQHYGPPVAFGVPGILMLSATVIFWLGRRKFVHIPPGRDSMVKEAFSLEGWGIVRRLLLLYVFIAVFFSLYFQSQSAWVLQADKMDRHWLGHDWLSEQLQAINSILVLVFIPLFSYVVYPLVSRVFPLTPLRKISIGLFLMAATFLITAWIEGQIHLGLRPNVKWQAGRLRPLDRGGSPGVHHGPGIFLHSGAPENEVPYHGAFSGFHVAGQSDHLGCHQTKRRRRSPLADPGSLRPVFYRPDDGGGGGFHFCGPQIQDPNHHPGRIPCPARLSRRPRP